MGAWLTYGLGTENQNLPGFVVLCPDMPNVVGPPLWGPAFLPAIYQGTYVSSKENDPNKSIRFIHNDQLDSTQQRRQLDLLGYRADRLNPGPRRDTLIAKMERLLTQHALVSAS